MSQKPSPPRHYNRSKSYFIAAELRAFNKITLDLDDLAQKHRMTPERFGRFIRDEGGAEILHRIEAYQEERARLLLVGACTRAVERLTYLALEGDSDETSRRACVELLKLARDNQRSTPAPQEGHSAHAPTDPRAEAILRDAMSARGAIAIDARPTRQESTTHEEGEHEQIPKRESHKHRGLPERRPNREHDAAGRDDHADDAAGALGLD